MFKILSSGWQIEWIAVAPAERLRLQDNEMRHLKTSRMVESSERECNEG